MNGPQQIFHSSALLVCTVLTFGQVGCVQSPTSCPTHPYADLSDAVAFADNDRLPFRLPLDDWNPDASHSYTYFCAASNGPDSDRKYHAAEDFFLPAGTPVYAMADGRISYSGTMGGYGWLIIIDHPQANLYSLYGHLSPSRWRKEPGTVEKGELIAYLGDSYENGGSHDRPLEPHLHLGVRAGQRVDYSGMGQWRWQAGWITPCPKDVGWLQPSAIITSQSVPDGGFPNPEAGFLELFWIEMMLAGIYLVGGVSMLIFAIKRRQPFVLVISSIVLSAAGWYFWIKAGRLSSVIFAMAVIVLATGIYQIIRRRMRTPRGQ